MHLCTNGTGYESSIAAAQAGSIAEHELQATTIDIGYLASNVIYLRYVGIKNRLSRAIACSRWGPMTLKAPGASFRAPAMGIVIGPVLHSAAQSILSGTPNMPVGAKRSMERQYANAQPDPRCDATHQSLPVLQL